jgi:hypothetical protein
MAEILVNTNNPIKHKVFWRGESVDADALPTVKVYDITEDLTLNTLIAPTTVLYTLTSEKVETDIGVYQITLPLTIADKSKSLKIKWEYNVGGSPVSKEHRVYVVTPYTDIDQAIDSINIGSDPSDPNYKTYNEVLAAERWARKIIEKYTGQQFYLYDETHIVHGAGTDVIPLPYKIHEIHKLTQNDIVLVDYLENVNNWGYTLKISETGFGIRVDRASMVDNTVYTANGMVPPSINDTYGGVFANGSTYRVFGRYGWEYVPDEVELACIELMKDYFSKDKNWRNKYIKNIQTFDWNFEYSSDAFSGTGNVYADQLLESYVLTQMVVI